MASASELWSQTAVELNRIYRSGDSDPVHATEACLARIEETNPALNAVISVDVDGAMRAAKASYERWRNKAPISLLDGVPLTIKDNLFVEGLGATWGSCLYKTYIAPVDDIPVARLRDSGAIILGKTNTPEFSLAGHTDNKIFGPTGNPWSPELSSGGSSGGAASAVMAGMGPLALVTDAGGSTRRPAAHVGCIGLKTSLERVPRRSGFSALTGDLQAIGLLARSTEDARAMFELIADPVLDNIGKAKQLRIAAFCAIGDHLIEPDVELKWREAIKIFTDMGHKVDEISAPYIPEEITQLLLDLASAGIARVVRKHENWRDEVTDAIAILADKGFETSAVEYVDRLDQLIAHRGVIRDLFRNTDLLLTPTTPVALWPRNEPFQKTIAGRDASPRDSGIYTTFVNIAGLPAISLPAGLDSRGHPVGIQLVGSINSEARLLDMAAQWEQVSPWDMIAPFKTTGLES